MPKVVALICCFTLMSFTAATQELIPYLAKSGLYGYATKDGKVAIAPAYLEAPFFDSIGTAVVTLPSYAKQILLPNGTLIPINGPVFDGLATNVTDLRQNEEYAIDALYTYNSYQECLLFNRKTGMYKLYLAPKSIAGDLGFDPFSIRVMELKNFYRGYKRVTKPSGINFVDLNLKEVFSQDVANGVYAGGQNFIIRNAQNKFGVVDVQGKEIVPFTFTSIGATPMDDVFILNYREFRSAEDSTKPAVFNAKTNLTIHLDYDYAKPVGDFLLVQFKGKYGLIDYKGKVIVPCDYTIFSDIRSPSAMYRNKFIFAKNDSAYIFDANGKNVLDGEFRNLFHYSPSYRIYPENHLVQRSFFMGSRRQKDFRKTELVVLDSVLNVQFVDTLHSKLNPNFSEVGRFFLSVNAKSGKSGVLSEFGKVLIPSDYSSIELDRGKAFVVKGDSCYGVFDLTGKLILPCRYEKIQIEQDYSFKNKFVVWAKEYGQPLYYAYEMDGKAANYRPFHYPTVSDLRGTFPSSRYENGKFFQKTRSGKEVESSLINGYYLAKSGENYLYFNKDGQFFDLRNEDFERIVPKGYKALRAHSTLGTGLIVVVTGHYDDQVQRVGLASEAVSDATGPPPAPGSSEPVPERAVGVKTVKGQEPPPTEVVVEEWGPPKQGVINSKGKWVLPPKVNGEYTIVNKFLISERISIDKRQSTYTLHKIGNKEPSKLEGLSNIIPTKKSIVSITKYVPRVGGGLEEFSCILDSTGREITPFNLVKLEHFHEMGDTIVAIFRKENGRNETVLMDLSARIVARIGPDRIAEVDKARNRLILVDTDTNLKRITDLQGRQVRKEIFKELDFRHFGTTLFYIGVRSDGRKCVFTDDGFDVIIDSKYDSLLNTSNAYAAPLANRQVMFRCFGYRLGKSYGFSILFGKNGKVLKTYPAAALPNSTPETPYDSTYMRFHSDDNQKFFYIDIASGMEYRE